MPVLLNSTNGQDEHAGVFIEVCNVLPSEVGEVAIQKTAFPISKKVELPGTALLASVASVTPGASYVSWNKLT